MQVKDNILTRIRAAKDKNIALENPADYIPHSAGVFPKSKSALATFRKNFEQLEGELFCVTDYQQAQQKAAALTELAKGEESCQILPCDFLVAGSGSIAIACTDEKEPLPLTCQKAVFIAAHHQIVDRVEQVFARLIQKNNGEIPPFVTFLTGASRTNYPGGLSTKGVYGSKKLIVIIYDKS